jgi:hypothetical protein
MKGFTDGQYQRFIDALDESISNLCDMFPGRVVFARVGKDACATNYHVWGANAGNWNLHDGQQIKGGGMAADMGVQREGVFGIVCATTRTAHTLRQECLHTEDHRASFLCLTDRDASSRATAR